VGCLFCFFSVEVVPVGREEEEGAARARVRIRRGAAGRPPIAPVRLPPEGAAAVAAGKETGTAALAAATEAEVCMATLFFLCL
jgi:hypothetical protein